MFAVLSGSKHCPLSIPFELGWLDRTAQEAQNREVLLVGEGVTSLEYASILERSQIPFVQVSTRQFLAEFCYENGGRINGMPFVLFAAPSRLLELTAFARTQGLRPIDDYLSHFDALRNRMVIDLRGGGADVEKLVFALKFALFLPTLGGIDVMASSISVLQEISPMIAVEAKALHTKAIFFPTIEGSVQISGLAGFDAVEINTTHLSGVEENFRSLFENLLVEVNANEKAYLMVTEEMIEKYVVFEFDRVYKDSSHSWYFDEMLLALESGDSFSLPCVLIGKTNNCLSRRMFPVLDERLMLKKCSLYDGLGKTPYPISEMHLDGFISERNALCDRCTKFKLHRIA